MYAKSFMALDGNGRLTGARTAQSAPYDHYTCHLCGSALQYHPQYDSERPWFEHQTATLSDNGRQHCPYVKPEASALRLSGRLQRIIPGATPVVRRADWHCSGCDSVYHGEHYCLTCRSGEYSRESADAGNLPAEVTTCAC
ncbi:hypothetical protein JAF88_004817 [Citrobacter freundii]|uniref:putative zinc ribbon protein n=1 Tax=Enterobacterales TaxID=91347 RepID=UPI000907A160|nr:MULTISPECIES: putative zinc ribbon protein [Enterobacterales]EGT0627995.1 hypothetical protein [Citrobacter freundii]